MIIGRKFLLSRLGFCEAGGMLFILVDSCNLLLTLVLWQEICSESFLLHRRVVFEGDSTLVINAITQEGAEFSSYGNIIDEICCIAADLKFVEFDHVSCVCNCVVDVLAKKAKNILGQQVWMEDPPDDIVPLLLFDVH